MRQGHLTASPLFARKGEAAPSAGGGHGFSTPALAWDEEAPPPSPAPVIHLTPARTAGPGGPKTPEPAAQRRPPPRPPATPDAQGRVRTACRLPDELYRIIRAQALAEGCAMADLLGAAVVHTLTSRPGSAED